MVQQAVLEVAPLVAQLAVPLAVLVVVPLVVPLVVRQVLLVVAQQGLQLVPQYHQVQVLLFLHLAEGLQQLDSWKAVL